MSAALLGAVATIALGASASATAATFTLPGATGVTNQPSVALDPNGNAYVAWVDATSMQTVPPVSVCEIPAGGTTCAQQVDLPSPAGLNQDIAPWVYVDSMGDPHVVISAENGSSAGEHEWYSVTQGETWTETSLPIGDLALSSAAFDPNIGSGVPSGNGVVFGASSHSYNGAYNVEVNASELGTGNSGGHDATVFPAGPNGPLNTASAVSDTASAISVVHAWDSGIPSNATGVGYSYYSGPALKGQPAATVLTDVGNASHWTTSTVNDGGRGISLAGGPAGIFLNEAIASGGEIANRQFTGSGFGSAAVADCGDTPKYGAGIQGSKLFEDPVSGALHFVYIESTGTLEDVRYTETLGASQSPPATLLETSTAQQSNPQVASDGAGHPGLAVWLTKGASNYTIEADWLPSVSLSGCPTTPGGAGGGGGTKAPTTFTLTTTTGDQQVTLTAPSLGACVAKTSKLTVTLSSKTLKKGTKFKLKQAAFYIDKGIKHTHKVKGRGKHAKGKVKKVTTYRPNAVAKHLPTTKHLSVAGLRSGTHALTVKLSYTATKIEKKKGKKVKVKVSDTKTLTTKFTIC